MPGSEGRHRIPGSRSIAKAEWQRDLDAVRTECRAQLVEADQLIKLQKEEANMLREEVELRRSQRDLVQRRLAARGVEAVAGRLAPAAACHEGD